MTKICIVYTHHKLGDLIWQLPYIKAISDHHKENIDLVVREKTQAKNILRDLKHITQINYNNFRKGLNYWIDVFKLAKLFLKKKYDFVYILDKVNKPAIAARLGLSHHSRHRSLGSRVWLPLPTSVVEEQQSAVQGRLGLVANIDWQLVRGGAPQ